MTTLRGGELLMIGFAGPTIDEEFADTLQETGARSVILFARNLVDANQCRSLVDEIRALVDWPLLIAIDQEGGVVNRLNEGVTHFPGAATLGAVNDLETTESHGFHLAQQMVACGVDLVLAPVVDLQLDDNNPIVGFRSFGGAREHVAEHAVAYLNGLARGGVEGCLKHFPGLGLATIDPHVGLPTIDAHRDQILDPHVAIFADVLSRAERRPSVMTTHVRLPALDPEFIATRSSRIVSDLLRGDLAFDGCVITDDLEMGGAEGEIEDVVLGAIHAGHDLLPICHRHELQRRAASAIAQAIDRGIISRERLEFSLRRIDSLRLSSPNDEYDASTLVPAADHLARMASESAVTILRGNELVLTGLSEANFAVRGSRPELFESMLLETNQDSAEACLFMAENLRTSAEEQKALSDAIEEFGENVVVFLLRSPADLAHIPRDCIVLTAFGNSQHQVKAMREFIFQF